MCSPQTNPTSSVLVIIYIIKVNNNINSAQGCFTNTESGIILCAKLSVFYPPHCEFSTQKMHCSVMAYDVIKAAAASFQQTTVPSDLFGINMS